MKTHTCLILVALQLALLSNVDAESRHSTPAGEGADGVILIRGGKTGNLSEPSDLHVPSGSDETYVRVSLVGASAVVQDSWWSDKSGAATSTVSIGDEKYSVASYFEFRKGNFGSPEFNTTIVNCRKMRQKTNTIRFSATLTSIKADTQLAVALKTIGKASVSIAAQLAKSYIPGTDMAAPLSEASSEIMLGFRESIRSNANNRQILWPAEGGLTSSLGELEGEVNYVLLYRGNKMFYDEMKEKLFIKDYAPCYIEDLPSTTNERQRSRDSTVTLLDGIWFLFKVEKLARYDGDRPWSPAYRKLCTIIEDVPKNITLDDPTLRQAAIARARDNLWRTPYEHGTSNRATDKPKTLGDQIDEMQAQISADPLITHTEAEFCKGELIRLAKDSINELDQMHKSTLSK